MEFFDDFLRMSAVERNEYVMRNGLTEEQKTELLSLNKIIASLIQQDCFWHERMRRELRKLEAITGRLDAELGR